MPYVKRPIMACDLTFNAETGALLVEIAATPEAKPDAETLGESDTPDDETA
jgi:hypothetical protein